MTGFSFLVGARTTPTINSDRRSLFYLPPLDRAIKRRRTAVV